MNIDIPRSAILVADDNPTDVFFLQRRLLKAGITNPLHHCEDGAEAIRWLERMFAAPASAGTRPWLMFLDLKMPRTDGFDVLRGIRDRGWLTELTVSVLTTSDEPVDVERATTLGAHRFLVKYPRPGDLIEVVALAARRVAARPAGVNSVAS